MFSRTSLTCGLLFAAMVGGSPACAAPEEIQVYMDEMDDPGDVGLDLHTNYAATGDRTLDYAGEQQSVRRLRMTPEFSYGVSKTFELGLYLPLATLDSTGRAAADGIKFRLKYIAPHQEGAGWFYGANFEIGRVDHKLDANPYNAELKLIGGHHGDRWTIALNGNVDFKVDGPVHAPPSFDIDTKISRAVTKTLAIGVETYNGAGEFARLGSFGSAEHSTFAIVDAKFGRWDINFGVGHGYSALKDGLIVKAIIGVPIGRPPRRDADTPG